MNVRYRVELAAQDAAMDGEAAARNRSHGLANEMQVLLWRLEKAQRDAQAAVHKVEALRRADAERQARGVLARLWAAWRGY